MATTLEKLCCTRETCSGVMICPFDIPRKAGSGHLSGDGLTDLSHPRFSEACRRRRVALAQVVPPGERQAGGVEAEIDRQRELRTAGRGDRGAEAARDQVAAT